MAKYTFTCQHFTLRDSPIDKITYEIEVDTLHELLAGMENFLKGSGFVFDGVLDIVPFETEHQDKDVTLVLSPHNEDRI